MSDGGTALAHVLGLFARDGGALAPGGQPIGALAAAHGTPLYVYDLGVAARKVALLRRVMGPDIGLHYAMKANPHPQVVRAFVELGLGIDVASGGELAVALAQGADAGGCSFAGPGKSDAEIAQAIDAGVGSINVESPRELEKVAEAAAAAGRTANVSLRVNPAQQVRKSGMRMGGGAQAFGIDAEQVPAVLARVAALESVRFVGFHVFAGSQNLDAEKLVTSYRGSLEALVELMPHAPHAPTRINLGGGFGIPYHAKDTPIDIAAVGAGLQALWAEFQPHFGGAQLHLESGRFLAGECGVYVCRVRDRKVSRGTTFLITDGGLHHHLAATGNFGQVIHRPYPVAAVTNLDAAPTEEVAVVGPLCTPLDTFGAKVPLPPLAEGDLIGVFCSGAYGFTASPRGFLSHPEPAEVVVGEITP